VSVRAPRRPALTGQAEDYLKAIYELERDGRAAGTKALAVRLGIAAPSVTGMLRRLGRLGFVETKRYHGSRLTLLGRRTALQLLRRHRIIETYLVTKLGYAWEHVHREAERLEHAASADLVERMAAVLGHPTEDPHGAPIPTSEGHVDERRLASLAELPVGARARVVRMSDRDPSLLRYLGKRGIRPGTAVRVEKRDPEKGPIAITVGRSRKTIGASAATKVWIEER
jgi:DtxR family Mn-dependent transcriptional regulator